MNRAKRTRHIEEQEFQTKYYTCIFQQSGRGDAERLQVSEDEKQES